jgi:hypothetical protein
MTRIRFDGFFSAAQRAAPLAIGGNLVLPKPRSKAGPAGPKRRALAFPVTLL